MRQLFQLLIVFPFLATDSALAENFWVSTSKEPSPPFERMYLIHRTQSHETGWFPLSDLPKNSANTTEQNMSLFYINDLHNKLVEPDKTLGDTYIFSQMMHRIEQRRSEKENIVLFLSGGDDHTGAVYDELLGTSVDNFKVSLAYHAYSQAGMTAAVIGNHEFDRGSTVLRKKIEGNANFPLLAANLVQSNILTHEHYAAALIGEVKGFRVGIIGLTSYEDTKTNLSDDSSLTLIPQLDALAEIAPLIAPHVDVVIALTHIGYQTDSQTDDRAVAAYLSNFSMPAIVVGGHSHTALYPSEQQQVDEDYKVNGVPIVQAGGWGEYLGELEIQLTSGQSNEPEMQIISNWLHPTTWHRNDAEFTDLAFQQRVIDPVLSEFDTIMNQVVAISADNQILNTPNTLAARYTGELAIANVMTDAIAEQLEVDLAAINASGILAGVPVGEDVTFYDWFQVMPYADVIHVLQISPLDLKNIINSNAQRVVKNNEAENIDLTDFVSRGFLHFSKAIRYRISGGGAVDISVHGRSITDYPEDHIFTVALGDYIVNGNQGWRGQPIGAGLSDDVIGYDLTAHTSEDTGRLMRDEVLRALRQTNKIPATLDDRVIVGE